MPIADRVNVQVIDKTPGVAVPPLNIPVILGTTPGKEEAKDRMIVATGIDSVAAYFDPSDREYVMAQRILSQTPRARKLYIWNGDRNDYKVATGTTGTVTANNAILWTSDMRGPLGDNVKVVLRDPGAYDQTLDVETYIKLITGSVDQNNALIWTSKKKYRDIIKIDFEDPGVANAPLKITVTSAELTTYRNGSYEHEIDIQLATDATGAITTTAADIVDAFTNESNPAYNAEAAELVTVEHAAGSDGSGTVSAMNAIPIPFVVQVDLATDSSGNITSTAEEVIQAVNGDVTSDAPKLVSAANYETSDGSGVVVAEEVELSRTNTPDSPTELTRMLDAMWTYVHRHGLEWPYFLVCTSHDEVPGDRLELSDAVSSRLMIYLTSCTPEEARDPEKIGELAYTMASDRTGIIAHTDPDNEYPEAALAGLWSGHPNGGFTTMWKKLNGISPARFDETEEALIERSAPGDYGAFTYISLWGTAVTTGSWATDGSFLDWRWDKDWLELWLTIDIVQLLKSTPKLLGDHRGISLLKGVVISRFNIAKNMGIIAEDPDSGKGIFYLDFPDLYEWATTDQNVRHYRIAKAVIKPASAIEQVTLYVYATNEMLMFEGREIGA